MPHILFEAPLEMDLDQGKDPEPENLTWPEIDKIMKEANDRGFIPRTIVVEKKMGQYQQPDPYNWGVIIRLDRYQQSGTDFKPVVCSFFKKGNQTQEYFKVDELLIVYPGKSWDDLMTHFREQGAF